MPELSAANRPPLSRAELLRDRRFVTLAGAFAMSGIGVTGLFAHMLVLLGPTLRSRGSAAAVSLTTAWMIGGRTLLGWHLGRAGADLDRRSVAAAMFLTQAAGSALLAISAIVAGPSPAVAALLGCTLFGIGAGNLAPMLPMIAQAEFPRADVQRVVALAFGTGRAGFAVGPALLGSLRDVTGNYLLALALAATVQIAATILVLASRHRASPHAG
jgi:MFS family permease